MCDLQFCCICLVIVSEVDNGLFNLCGMVVVVCGVDFNLGILQFFFNFVDNCWLDFVGSQSGLIWGYVVFGKVIKGMDVVDKIVVLLICVFGFFVGDVFNFIVVIIGVEVVGDVVFVSIVGGVFVLIVVFVKSVQMVKKIKFVVKG